MPPSIQANLTPREAFARFQELLLGEAPDAATATATADLYADDVVIELPFARPGMPSRFDGRASFAAFAATQRASLPARFEEFRNVVIHDTADPEVIIAEYDLAGTVTTTTTVRQASQPFVLVLRVRAGRIVHLREYQNVLGIAAELGQLPELLASLGRDRGLGLGLGREPADVSTDI